MKKGAIRSTVFGVFHPAPRALLLCVALLIGSCLPTEDHEDLLGAYSEIGAAIDFKANECGHRPAYPMVLPARPSRYGTRLCSLTIMRQACPFNDYPLFCLEMYSLECKVCDLPLIGP